MNFGQHCWKNLFHYQKLSIYKKIIFLKSALNSGSKNWKKNVMNFGQQTNIIYHMPTLDKDVLVIARDPNPRWAL